MDLPPPGAGGAATVPSRVGLTDPTPTPTPHAKLRLLCSYGGKIAPRPHSKVLCYVGGETRVVAVDRCTVVSFSFLLAHLSHTLLNGRPFSLKYQLPGHDLDSLISITTDEDLTNMIDEYDRLSLAPQSPRLRFFLFPSKPDPLSPDSSLHDPKSDTWFFDALRNARGFADSGTGVGNGPADGQVESEGRCGVESESFVLDTSSSFGSTGSSASGSNPPAIRIGGEEANGAAAVPQDLKVNLYPVDSIGSDSSLTSLNFQPQNIFYQDATVHPEYHLKVPSNPVETGSNVSDHSARTDSLQTVQPKGYPVLRLTDQLFHQPPMPSLPSLQPQTQSPLQCLPQQQAVVYHDAVVHPEYKGPKIETERNPSDPSRIDLIKKVEVLGYPLSQPVDQLQQQSTSSQPPPTFLPPETQLQYFHPGAAYMPHCYPITVPTTSYPTLYQPSVLQQQQGHYQLNKPCPVYIMPFGQAPLYDLSMPGHLVGSSSVAPTRVPLHSEAVMVSSPLVYDSLTPSPPASEYMSKVYTPTTVATPPSNVPSDERQRQVVTFPLTNQPSPPIVAAESADYISEHEDPVHAQIYKSQPPAPVMPSQFHHLANSGTVFSENLTQLHLEKSIQPELVTNPQLL